MRKFIDISRGPTFDHILWGTIAGFINFMIFNYDFISGIAISPITIAIVLSIKGVELDPVSKEIRPYFNFLGVKFGSWSSLSDYDSIMLEYVFQAGTRYYKSLAINYRHKYFEVVLNKKGGQKLPLKEFKEYSKAQAFLNEYSNTLDLEAIDQYKLLTESAMKRRLARR